MLVLWSTIQVMAMPRGGRAMVCLAGIFSLDLVTSPETMRSMDCMSNMCVLIV